MARIRQILKKRTFFLFSRVCVGGGGEIRVMRGED